MLSVSDAFGIAAFIAFRLNMKSVFYLSLENKHIWTNAARWKYAAAKKTKDQNQIVNECHAQCIYHVQIRDLFESVNKGFKQKISFIFINIFVTVPTLIYFGCERVVFIGEMK